MLQILCDGCKPFINIAIICQGTSRNLSSNRKILKKRSFSLITWWTTKFFLKSTEDSALRISYALAFNCVVTIQSNPVSFINDGTQPKGNTVSTNTILPTASRYKLVTTYGAVLFHVTQITLHCSNWTTPSISNPLSSWGGLRGSKLLP